MGKVSIITPWLDCPELIATYEASYTCANGEVVIIDNGSKPENAHDLRKMAVRMNGTVIRNGHNAKFAAANNQGASVATGSIIVFINNDTEYSGNVSFCDVVANEVKNGALYGPRMNHRQIAGRNLPYIEGFCIAATRATWERVGWWDADNFTGMYWEDNAVCFKAMQQGIELIETNWPVWHRGNYTSENTAGAYDKSITNLSTFTDMVRHAT